MTWQFALETGAHVHRSHHHYSSLFHPDRLITFAWHPGDVPRGIVADIIEDLVISRDAIYFGRF